MARPKKPPRWLEAARLRNEGARAGQISRPVGWGDWLSRSLARAGVLPLRDAEEAIRAGRVVVDSREVTEPLAPVSVEKSVVKLDGKRVSLTWRTRVLMLHKPAGVVTHGSDPEGIGTVFDVLLAALPFELQRFGWHAVGRLDRDTTGLLLFTNDERFVAHATQPETHLPKRYVARVSGVITDQKLATLRAGIKLDGFTTRPAKAQRRAEDVVELIITEGKYHQVKRMLGEVGLPTLALHREAVGGLELDVAERTLRELSDTEIQTHLRFEVRAG
ncbi:MAG: rRNA pseudouridine synthase [Archangium sp.]|nr:rRNA pseudouridine synthase [Archangium sp.]